MSGKTSSLDEKPALGLMGEAPQQNTTAAQRARIILHLQCLPASRRVLERECWVPSVTKRISELRREGWPIVSTRTTETGPDGSVSDAVVYSLAGSPADGPQLTLPLAP